jgi:hypothetical protein
MLFQIKINVFLYFPKPIDKKTEGRSLWQPARITVNIVNNPKEPNP